MGEAELRVGNGEGNGVVLGGVDGGVGELELQGSKGEVGEFRLRKQAV